MRFLFLLGLFFCTTVSAGNIKSIEIEPSFLHLRNAEPREWSEFAENPDAASLELTFTISEQQLNSAQDSAWTLQLRQRDVKQRWDVKLNDKVLGQLVRDENDTVTFFEVSQDFLKLGENRLTVSTNQKSPADDINLGQISLITGEKQSYLASNKVLVNVEDSHTLRPIPCRITILDENGSLFETSALSSTSQNVHPRALYVNYQAVRPGVIYISRGQVEFGLPCGNYTIIASRGFEYSIHQVPIDIKQTGTTIELHLTLKHEVLTEEYIACDPHTHTRTHSGHGDATVIERMVTLAGEGIELPIATDHDVIIDHRPWVKDMKLSNYFTPVMGDEVTTQTGHFNVFPFEEGATPPDASSPVWKETFDSIFSTPGAKVAILNHARDIHRGTRPFSPRYFNDVVGENLDGWDMRFNAMEVINSGATQTDIMRLFHDWMALLNRGQQVTPVGSSDSHDVSRYIVGQGRTYIKADDQNPGKIDVNQAVNNFLAGKVMVSYGLLAEMKVNDEYQSGELARIESDEINVQVRVLGPHWVSANVLELYANGQLVKVQPIDSTETARKTPGVIATVNWSLPKPKHDVHLVAIARGPGIKSLHWPTAKPYQPLSPEFDAQIIGSSGAIWIDGDGNHEANPAREYAETLFEQSKGELSTLLDSLKDYDAAIAAQAVHLYLAEKKDLLKPESLRLINQAANPVKIGILNYIEAWKKTEKARATE